MRSWRVKEERHSQGDSCRMQLLDRRREEEAVKGTDDTIENLEET